MLGMMTWLPLIALAAGAAGSPCEAPCEMVTSARVAQARLAETLAGADAIESIAVSREAPDRGAEVPSRRAAAGADAGKPNDHRRRGPRSRPARPGAADRRAVVDARRGAVHPQRARRRPRRELRDRDGRPEPVALAAGADDAALV